MFILSDGMEEEQNGRVDDDVQRESRAQMRELRAGLESELPNGVCGRKHTN